MSKIKKFAKYQKTLIFFNKKELKINFFRSIYENLKLPFFFRYFIYYNFIQKIKAKNIKLFCLISGNNRSKYSFFNISRIKIRDLTSYRNLVGVRKSSW